jgi:hypothetical protein
VRRTLLLLLLCLALGCRAGTVSPEERVRAVLAEIEAAAERANVRAMKDHVSESYGDNAGNDKRRLAQIVAFHLARNRTIHLLTRIPLVEFPAPGEARALAFVAMAGSPIEGPEALLSLRADLYRFELWLRDEDGDWRVSSAAWRPAEVEDFR